MADGYAAVHEVVDGFVTLANPEKGIEILKARGMDVPVSFKVNPALSRFYFATQKKQDGTFLVNSFCTDGGGIPRNVILENGLLLVDFGAITLQEFVLKSSFETACRLGKGCGERRNHRDDILRRGCGTAFWSPIQSGGCQNTA